jgi:hypothetical protein
MKIEDLDDMVEEMLDYRKQYDEQKEVSNDLHRKYRTAQDKLMDALEKTNKTKYHVAGLGTASLVNKLKVRMPQDPDKKQEFLEYMINRDDVKYSLLNVPWQSLQAWYNTETEARDGDFQCPGIDAPTMETTLRFTRER